MAFKKGSMISWMLGVPTYVLLIVELPASKGRMKPVLFVLMRVVAMYIVYNSTFCNQLSHALTKTEFTKDLPFVRHCNFTPVEA